MRLIEDGRLEAIDCSEPGGMKKIYRVSEEALMTFAAGNKVASKRSVASSPPAGLPAVENRL